MQNIKLLLELTAESKEKYRKMSRIFHPDKEETGDEEIMKEINKAKDMDSDKAIQDLYDELILGKKPSSKHQTQKQQQTQRPQQPQQPQQTQRPQQPQQPKTRKKPDWHNAVRKKRKKRQEKVRKAQRG